MNIILLKSGRHIVSVALIFVNNLQRKAYVKEMRISKYRDYSIEPKYDIRELRVGGWSTSRIAVEKFGNWSRFIDTDTNQFINKTPRINYSEKYVPPKWKRRKEASKFDKGTAYDQMFVTALRTHSTESDFVLTLDITPEMLASIPARDTQGKNTERSCNVKREKPKTVFAKSKFVVFDASELPISERIINKRKGENIACPNRVSSLPVQSPRRRKRSDTELMVIGKS